MNKKQKIWFAVFLAMFLVPEILWSPVGNFLYQIFQSGNRGGTYPFRENFLTITDNANMLAPVFFFQVIGLFGLFFWFLFSKQKKIFKFTGLILSIGGLALIGFALFLLYSFSMWR